MSRWIFLRGLMRESRHWGDFPERFRAHVPDAEVFTPDLPGNGRLHAVPSPQRIEETMEACRRMLADAALAPPYHVLGLSLGAMVAIAWAQAHPQELRGCVLINTSLRPFHSFYRRLRPTAWGAAARAALAGTPQERERLILRLTSNRLQRQAEVLDAWIAWQREHPVSRRNAWRQLLAAAHFRARPSRPPVPILVLAGAGDRLVDPACSRQLAAHWQTGFALHPSAGHDLPLDEGEWVARQVRDWLQEQELAGAAKESLADWDKSAEEPGSMRDGNI